MVFPLSQPVCHKPNYPWPGIILQCNVVLFLYGVLRAGVTIPGRASPRNPFSALSEGIKLMQFKTCKVRGYAC
jgi:hypothetical protein